MWQIRKPKDQVAPEEVAERTSRILRLADGRLVGDSSVGLTPVSEIAQ